MPKFRYCGEESFSNSAVLSVQEESVPLGGPFGVKGGWRIIVVQMSGGNKDVKKVSNPPVRYSSTVLEWLDEPPELALEVYEERAKSIITPNKSPDVSFSYSVNPYRGCFHGCAYCYARPTHQYIEFGAGTDFERRLVAKVNAPELLREAFMKQSWRGDTVVFSGITDCYQPLEASYELTRRCLEVCLEFRNPVAIITKGALVRRDLDLLLKLHEEASVEVFHSIAFDDDLLSKKIEPYAPRPSVRFRAMRELSEAGVPVSLALAPVIPALNDKDIPKLLARAKECGARSVFMTLLRLPQEVAGVFEERLREEFPDRAKKVMAQLRDMRGGKLNNSEFTERMKGEGPLWEAIQQLFELQVERLGFNVDSAEVRESTFRRPSRQLSLF